MMMIFFPPENIDFHKMYEFFPLNCYLYHFQICTFKSLASVLLLPDHRMRRATRTGAHTDTHTLQTQHCNALWELAFYIHLGSGSLSGGNLFEIYYQSLCYPDAVLTSVIIIMQFFLEFNISCLAMFVGNSYFLCILSN